MTLWKLSDQSMIDEYYMWLLIKKMKGEPYSKVGDTLEAVVNGSLDDCNIDKEYMDKTYIKIKNYGAKDVSVEMLKMDFPEEFV